MFCYSDIKNVYYKITEVFDEMNIKPKFNTRFMHSRKTLAVVSLLFMIALLSSPFISEFSKVSPFALGAPDKIVDNEEQLVKAIADAPDGEPWTISIGKDFSITQTMVVPAGKNITLISESPSSFYFLRGADGKNTITVERDGELRLDGIVVTHVDNTKGSGVVVDSGATLIMSKGAIFNNNVTGDGGGVINYGDFRLTGGDIYNNTATGNGGGVYNRGNFNVTDGAIRGNNAKSGGGVCNDGDSFRITGGQISNNVATNEGGGVSTDKNFTMTGGRISNNKADNGGGVASYNCIFTISGGAVSFNAAASNGGGVFISDGNMSLTNNGMIFNNTAAGYGGGVFSRGKVFEMSDGIVSNNTALDGGGIYASTGDFNMARGTIANNTATRNGGGVGVPSLGGLERVDIRSPAVFSNNRAATAYNRSTAHDELYEAKIGRSVTWSFNFGQGYNNYDIQYTAGTRIDNPETSPSPSATATASPTPTSTSTPGATKTPTPTPTTPAGDRYFWVIVAVIILVACLIIALMFFYFKKNATQQVAPDWIDSTPPPSPADYSNSAIV